MTQTSGAVTGPTCSGTPVKVVDLHADFREIWKGTETADTGKQTGVRPTVVLDFDTTVQPNLVTAQFVPVKTDGTCGPSVPAQPTASVLASQVWGTVTTDVARAPVPSPFNVLVKDTISGIVNVGGPVAAGGDIVLSGVSVNGTAKQPVGLIAGGKVSLSSGSVFGDVTYGVASTIPATLSVSGTKSLKSFSGSAAFQDLASLSVLLAEEPANGVAKTTAGVLQLTGTKTTLNVFQISSDALAQATSLQISVPANSGTLVNVTGNMTVSFQNKGLSLQGATAATMLWNAPAAPFVQISGIALSGSLLAPRALVTFDSGSFNGTLVAASFASTGSGALIHAPLNTTKLFGSNSPSAVKIAPAQDLVQGCTYQFVIPGTVPFTASGACLSPPVSVTFRVAAGAAPPSGRELTNVEPDPVLHTLRRFTAKAGINTPVDDIWARYESSIGIAASNLVPTTITAPSSTRTGQTVTAYQQYVQGYPVVGYGYFVAAEGGIFRAANGKVMPGLPPFASATVSAATALQSALTAAKITQAPWITKPTVNHAPVGQLVVLPKRTFPRAASDFALVWTFRFGAGTGIFEPAGAKIDAATGAVLGLDSGIQSFTPLNAGATYAGSQVTTSVDTVYDGPAQPFNVALYKNPDQTQVGTLASGDINGATVLGTVTGVIEDAVATIVGTPQFVVHPATTPWTAADKTEQRMATLQWSLGLANTFMQSLDLRIGGVPWLNIDGPTAHQKVLVNYTNGLPVPPISPVHYSGESSTADVAQIFFYTDPAFLAFQAGAVAHEYTHALIDSLRRASGLGGAKGVGTLANYKEAGSLNEGLADLFAIAANRVSKSARSLPWYCIEVDKGSGPACVRNIKEPFNSDTIPANPGQPPQPGLAPLYLDTLLGYHDYTSEPITNCNDKSDNCGVHWNSTVISHWGYILGLGVVSSANTCRLTVEPLDADPDKSLAMVLKIALLAMSSRTALPTGGLRVEASFADFRDATLQVSQELIDQGVLAPEALAKVELAWDAVGLPSLASHSNIAAPANVSGAYPWATFQWPLTGDGQTGTSWDFQLTNGTFDSTLAFHTDGISGVSKDGLNGVLPLALPSNSSDSFFWRVRPHDSTPWEICYPIHSFAGTTVPDPVNNMKVVKELESVTGVVVPGPFDVGWSFVRGTVKPNYDSWLATKSSQCPPGADVTKLPTDALSDDGTTQSDSVGFITQPHAHYFMTVQPSGPPDYTGATTRGGCATLEFDTGDLPPPKYDQPGFVATGTFDTSWAPGSGLKWETSGGAVKSLVYLFDRDESGVCGSTPIGDPVTVTLSGEAEAIALLTKFPGSDTTPNPTGYCWNVVDIAANGVQSAPSSPKGEVIFEANAPIKTSPGVTLSDTVNMIPSPLPGDSFGKDVTFKWVTEAQPGFPAAPAYGVRVGRWPWSKQLATPQPANGAGFAALLGSTTPETDFTAIFRAGEAKTVSGEKAGKGRYCWSVWPILDDPLVPEQPWARQPKVSLDPIWCYTSGPAMPIFNVPAGTTYSIGDTTPAPAAFSPQPIQGELQLDYIPGVQVKVNYSSPDIAFGPVCQTTGTFQDIYDCKIPFTITPKRSTTYTIDVKTYSSDLATPVMDDTTQVHHVVETIKTGPCGSRGQVCCPQNMCDNGVCAGSQCVESKVTILSPVNGVTIPSDGILVLTWTDPNPTTQYAVTSADPATGYTTTTLNPTTGTAATVQQFQILPSFILLGGGKPFTVTICPRYADGSSGGCDQRLINGDPPPNCNEPLAAPVLLQPPQSAAAACTNISDPAAKMTCIFNAQDSNFCDLFPIRSAGLGIGWAPVPGATAYELLQLGAYSAPIRTLPVTSSKQQFSTALSLLPALGGTVELCGFVGYGVAVTAVDTVCNRRSTTTLTGFGYEP